MQKIDITMTATIRPLILKETLTSFYDNLFFENPDRYRLIINIDPVGEKNKTYEDVLKICNIFFKKILYIIPKKPSFPKAVISTWSKVEENFYLNLEDDWILNKKLDINDMINILDNNRHLACLRLSKYDIPNKPIVRLFNSNYSFKNGVSRGYYEAEDRQRQFGLNPVLIRKEFVKEAVPLMVPNINPEKQFRYENEMMRDFIMKWTYAIYAKPGDKAYVTDNGINWKQQNRFKKPAGKTFLEWVKE